MDYAKLLDSELLNLMKVKEDELAFGEIYNRYWKPIFSLAYKKVDSKELAEELTQNIFVSLWERKTNLDVQNLNSWLHGALKFSVINHYKTQVVHNKFVDYSINHHDSCSHHTDQTVSVNDLLEAIEKGIPLMPNKTQKVFTMSRIDNLTVKEISKNMEISEKAVEYHITQSLKAMKLHLKDFLTVFLMLVWL